MGRVNGHIFISYAREDRDRVAILAKLIEDEGWSVWWDRENMSAGRSLNEVIDSAINDSSCVLVCWSSAAIKSRWVIDEATEGLEQEKLLPVLFDNIKPPYGFRSDIHYIDLSEWDEKETHAAYRRLKSEIIKIQPLTNSDEPTLNTGSTDAPISRNYPDNVPALIDLLDNPLTEPDDRLAIGNKLAEMGDTRPGVGLNKNGLPDIDWVKIPGGKFFYGEQKESREIKNFFISRYPITNIQYEAFINDNGYENDKWWKGLSKRIENTITPQWEQSNRPRDSVNWYEAIAYCRWLSDKLDYMVKLPTEKQWERTARGTDGREYPWGNKYVLGLANVDETHEIYHADEVDMKRHFLEQTTAVGLYSLGASPEGVLDMSGNVWEWCLNGYRKAGSVALKGKFVRVLRGGCAFGSMENARASARFGGSPISRFNYGAGIGFRVVCSSPIIR